MPPFWGSKGRNEEIHLFLGIFLVRPYNVQIAVKSFPCRMTRFMRAAESEPASKIHG